MLESAQNTYTLPSLGLAMVLAALAAEFLGRSRVGPLLATVGVLFLFASVHRYGSGPGSASPALHVLIGLNIAGPAAVGLFNTRVASSVVHPWSGLVLTLPMALLLPIPRPEWVSIEWSALPIQYLVASLQLSVLAACLPVANLPRHIVGAALLQFGWLLAFGTGSMGGQAPVSAAVATASALLWGMGLNLVWNPGTGTMWRSLVASLPATILVAALLLRGPAVAWLAFVPAAVGGWYLARDVRRA